MKIEKILIVFLICSIVFPLNVRAKEYCTVVSGNGKDLGSEIACGTEHFYVIDSNQEEINMLAKYNLYTGISIYKEKIEKEEGSTKSDYEYCDEIATSKGGIVKSDGFYNEPGYCFYTIDNIKFEEKNYIEITKEETDKRTDEEYCFEEVSKIDSAVFDKITTNPETGKQSCEYEKFDKKIVQTEDAKSAHWDNELNYLYPQVGDVYINQTSEMITEYKLFEHSNTPIQENTKFYDFNIKAYDYSETANSPKKNLYYNLHAYKFELQKMGYDIKK